MDRTDHSSPFDVASDDFFINSRFVPDLLFRRSIKSVCFVFNGREITVIPMRGGLPFGEGRLIAKAQSARSALLSLGLTGSPLTCMFFSIVSWMPLSTSSCSFKEWYKEGRTPDSNLGPTGSGRTFALTLTSGLAWICTSRPPNLFCKPGASPHNSGIFVRRSLVEGLFRKSWIRQAAFSYLPTLKGEELCGVTMTKKSRQGA